MSTATKLPPQDPRINNTSRQRNMDPPSTMSPSPSSRNHPEKTEQKDNNNNNNHYNDFIVIDEVEWAPDDNDDESTTTTLSSGELAPRPKLDRHSDPCGCKPPTSANNANEPCCNDMSCVLFACQEECRNNCEAGRLCRNKRLTRKEWKDVQVFDAGVKGKGLRTLEGVRKGELITEYVGRAIRKQYLDLLFQRYRNERMLYIMALDNDTYIDARQKGGLARFINHSCEPNCTVERWKVRGVLRAGIYALRDIPAGTELSFDYKWDRKRGRAPTKCHCLSSSCRGTLEVAKSMEEDELERRLVGHWKKPTTPKAGREIINRSIKILLTEHHEYFSADVCKYDDTTGKHLVIYRHDLEEVWEDLSKEEWMILDEEAEQFVIAKKTRSSTTATSAAASPSTASLLGSGLIMSSATVIGNDGNMDQPTRRFKNYMFVDSAVKEQFVGRHLIERCERNCHVKIELTQCVRSFETPLPDDEAALEQQRALDGSKDGVVWKLTITGYNIAKAYMILEKNVDFIEKSLRAEAFNERWTAATTAPEHGVTRQEVIIPRCVVEHVKRRFPELRDKCRSVNIAFAHSESKSKQFSRLILEATLVSDLEVAKQHIWVKLISICSEEKAPMAPSGIYKDLGFLGGELSDEQFRLLLDKKNKGTLSQECAEDLRSSPFFSSFENVHRCTVWVQSLEDKGRIDRKSLTVSESSPNAPRKVYFGCAPEEIPHLWDRMQLRASEIAWGVQYLYLGADSMFQQLMMQKGCQFFEYIKNVSGVSVSIDPMTGDHLRLDGRGQEASSLLVPSSQSGSVALAEDIIRLQIELYRDHFIRQQNWIFGRDWTLVDHAPTPTIATEATPGGGKLIASSRTSAPSARNPFEPRAVAFACVEIDDIVSKLELSGDVAAHAVIIMYRFVSVAASNQEYLNSQLKVRDLLLGCVLLACKAQKVTKWKRIDPLLEAAYKTFFPGSTFSRDNEEATILEKRVMNAESEIVETLHYDIFWRGSDWVLTMVTEAGQIAEPLASNALNLALSGPVFAAGQTLWLNYGVEYVFAAVAGFLSIDLETVVTALSLIPLKVSQAAEIIANSIKAGYAGRKRDTHNLFTAGNDALAKQVPLIKETCIKCTSNGLLQGRNKQSEQSDSMKTYEIIGRRDNRQRIFRRVDSRLVRNRIAPLIDGLCADSNCKIFVAESSDGVNNDIILQGSWRALAIAEHRVISMCSNSDGSSALPSASDDVADRDLSATIYAKDSPGVMSMSAMHTNDGWKGTIQSAVLDDLPSCGRKVGGKCCIAGKITEDAVRHSGLRWWVPPRYAPSPSGSVCDMVALNANAGVHRNGASDLPTLATLARDLVGDRQSSETFPSLTAYAGLRSETNEVDGRFMAVSLQRWPSEKVSNREQRANKGSSPGVSPAALQEMKLLVQLHSLIPSPQGHPNFILPIGVALPPYEAGIQDMSDSNDVHSLGKSSEDEIFSLLRSSEDNEKVAQKEKKKRKDLATGAHLVFHPTPFILQRFTSRSSRRQSGESSQEHGLASSILTGWFHDLLSALAHCHENHVVLRTLQPDQIVIDFSGVAKLGGLYRATVLPEGERRRSPSALKSALSRKDKGDEGEEPSSTLVAPEILLGSPKHTKESDVWSLGCILASLLLNKSLFVAKDKASLLVAIFKIVGAPRKENYPEAAEFPFYTAPPKKYKRGVARAIKHMMGDDDEAQKHNLALDLLDRMLHLDPAKRISAADALKHECMVQFIENCRNDSFRLQYVNDWLALRKRFLQASKSADEDARKKQSTMKREAMLMAANNDADDGNEADDDLYGDLLRGGGNKKLKTNGAALY